MVLSVIGISSGASILQKANATRQMVDGPKVAATKFDKLTTGNPVGALIFNETRFFYFF
jgi:hypothetical protein